MASRIVALGPKVGAGERECVPYVEVAPTDAEAVVNAGMCRVAFTLYSAELRDATVLVMAEPYVLTVAREYATSMATAAMLGWCRMLRVLGHSTPLSEAAAEEEGRPWVVKTLLLAPLPVGVEPEPPRWAVPREIEGRYLPAVVQMQPR